MRPYATVNPVNGHRIREYPTLPDAAVDTVVDGAHRAFHSWRNVGLDTRADILRRVATIHRERAQELASILTLEMGKPITQALGEVALVASIYDYYADNAAKFLADEVLDIAGGGEAIVRTEPIGVLVGIMPWNYPYYQVARFAAPNLILGNTVILKHARNCPQSALAIERVLLEAGLPTGAYTNVFATSAQISTMIADRRVQGVSLTGSEQAGSAVGEIAGRHMKKYVLELGGSDPFIVLGDANLDAAATAAVVGRMNNAGQACTASKRFIVVDEVFDNFVRRFVEAMRDYPVGDPTDPETRLGPLASEDTRSDLATLVDEAVEQGARVLVGGAPLEGDGAYYPATVLTGVTPQMRAYHEELFGPVAVVYRARDAEDAIRLANDSPFGLASTVFSSDVAAAKKIATRLDTGMVWINSTSRSAPDLPFGGVKRSGVGRELAKFGINEFANKKLVRTP